MEGGTVRYISFRKLLNRPVCHLRMAKIFKELNVLTIAAL
jgi:hypothetical protein